MRLVITDTGNVWNADNPYLERFKDIVLVVCLQGKAITDKYECFVAPYQQASRATDKYGVEDQKFQMLASVAEKLNSQLRYHDDIVFLADNEPSTLYPYYVIKDLNKYNSLHLVTMSPWPFEGNKRTHEYNKLLTNLSGLSSILYYDSCETLGKLPQETTIPDVFDFTRKYLGDMMSRFLNGIYAMRNSPCFFDFASMSYVPLEDGFKKIDIKKRNKEVKDIKFPIQQEFSTLGISLMPLYPENSKCTKREVEQLAARLDGKKVCNVLREQRIRLAEANGIPFKSEECPSIGPCAGTCEKCDMESKYLRKQLQKISEEKRVYPQFDPQVEVTL